MLTVEQTGREALAEMRRLLGVLRREDDPRALAPQPGLDQLSELLAATRAQGLECELRLEGSVPLTPGVDLVAYRVIEAVLASSVACRGRCAEVTVSCQGGTLELDVSADGFESDIAAGFRDRLAAVTHRVELYDGRLWLESPASSDGRAPGSATLVHCRLPLGTAVAV